MAHLSAAESPGHRPANDGNRDLLLPFAQQIGTGRYVSPEEVERGLACNCQCPGCLQPVQARKGTERAWHFAHVEAGDCADAYERSVHETAKQMLREHRALILPSLQVQAEMIDALGHRLIESEPVCSQLAMAFDSCHSDRVVGQVKPDVLAIKADRRLLIEVTVFHQLTPDKRERLIDTGLASLEIDLSMFKTAQASRARLAEAMFSSDRHIHWIWHPREPEAKALVAARLAERAQTSKLEFDKQRDQRIAAEAERRQREQQAIEMRNGRLGRLASDARHSMWRASYPPEASWSKARSDFCARHGLNRADVDAVMSQMRHRGDLSKTTPEFLAEAWARELGVAVDDMHRYFQEAGFLL